MSTFGDRLRNLRKENGKTQKDFGKLFGLSESAIGMYERNERKPDYETLEKFAGFLNTSVNFLITGKEVEKSDGNSTLSELTEKDEKDIAKRMEKMKKDLKEASMDGDGLNFMGEPMSEEAIDSLLEALEHAERIATLANKKYTPNKYKNKE